MSRRFAILGDIHANLEALHAVLHDAQRQAVTDFICVGDVVGYNAEPAACVRVIRDELACPVVCGNHDYYCSCDKEEEADLHSLAASTTAWTRTQLSEEDAQWLRALPPTHAMAGITFVHSTLGDPLSWQYVFDTEQAAVHFQYQKTALCFAGHTHIPAVFEKTGVDILLSQPEEMVVQKPGTQYFINGGSVGQPRDGDPRASYVIYTPATHTVTFRRVEYDVEATVARNRAAGLPGRLSVLLAFGH